MTVQVCNPSCSLKWSADKKFEDDPRYSGAGKLAPKSHADFVFVKHMVYHMDEDDGRVAVLLSYCHMVYCFVAVRKKPSGNTSEKT